MKRGERRQELPGAYRRPNEDSSGAGRSWNRKAYPPKPSRYSSTSYNTTTDNDFGMDSVSFDETETSGTGSRNTSTTIPSGSSRNISNTTSGTSFESSRAPPIPEGKKRTISMGANHRPYKTNRNLTGSRYRSTDPGKNSRSKPSFTISDSTPRTTSGSDGSSIYSSAESFDSQDDFEGSFPPRPPKPDKYRTSSSSNFTGNFYPNPLESADMGRLNSGYTEDSNTTITAGDDRPTDIDELADYFNKKLEDVQRQADSAMHNIQKGKDYRSDSYQDDSSMFSYNRGPPGGGSYGRRKNFDHHTVRLTNRAIGNLTSDASTLTPTNSSSFRPTSDSQQTDSSISAVRGEIETLKSQISKSLKHLSSHDTTTSQDMDQMADYFSKRLEQCQKQVYNAVHKVQNQVGELKKDFDGGAAPARNRSDWEGREDEMYDSSDSGIGPRNLTIRPPARAQGGNPYPMPPEDLVSPTQSTIQSTTHRSHHGGHHYPPPMSPSHDGELDALESVHHEKFPSSYPPTSYLPKLQEGDDFYLGSDDEDDWDDFEDFIDDDTPAPETSTPVPRIVHKQTNYVYQTLYALYICAFLAYVYVRVQFTLDAPGLNRIYCIVVAILEIVTAPSLLLQGLCLWKWISRDPAPADAFERPKFHTARIMVPTYKEPLEVVAGTVHEIIHMDLPPHFHVHVYVLDDGKREILEKWVLSKRTKRRVYLHYVARPKLPGVPHHAKAGNINHTLHYVFDDAYAEKECVIIFDADFMPRRNYLLRVLPVFSEKRTRPIGLVQTPQFFYNVHPDQDVWDHLNVSFFHRIEPSLDRWSAVNCCGTNFVVRADALKDVGYFPVGCLTEDTLLSLRLCTMGWGVAYHHEVLAIGQSPHEITEIFKQRSRWCKGNLQIFLDEFPLMQSGLSLSQRIFYSSCGFNYFCASISIPFFQLVPAWAIFFGLWPVSQIGLEFAFAFMIYYLLGNLLLLFPPPGFSIRDMWNGELASTNLWFTYFNGVRRIVGTKLLKGKGELTFKTTKKKTEDDEEGSKVGFQKEDVRACYMHFIMFFIMLVTIIYAVIKAIVAQNVKFYFYFMYMIGMSWAMINMTPYLIVVIYCWYRVHIPGLVVACFRYVQLLLRIVCVILIMVQAFTTRNLTENFECPHAYTGVLGVSKLAVVKYLDVQSGLEVSRNAFWLLGLNDDFYTIQQIKQTACNEDEIPIIVFFMHPSQGLALDAEAGHYMPDQRIDTWDEYDELITKYSEELTDVPSLIVMEPSLLMHTYNSKSEYHNTDYQIAFTQRVQRVVDLFPNSWVYVDSGNAMYLQWQVNLNHIISVMKQMPPTIRGFSINVGSFVNTTFNEQLAREIHCQTGLHYIIDTSRNGGEFSTRTLDQINECTYDPPGVSNGTKPTFEAGAAVRRLTAQSAGNVNVQVDIDDDEETTGPTPQRRRKRWQFQERGQDTDIPFEDPAEAYYSYEDNNIPDDDAGPGDYDLTPGVCVSTDASGLDAYAWVKTPGESDGRMFPAGTYHPCLLNHFNECSDTCPQYVPKISGEFQRPDQCQC